MRQQKIYNNLSDESLTDDAMTEECFAGFYRSVDSDALEITYRASMVPLPSVAAAVKSNL